MKNRGFTLLELLGVIVILALLTTLVFPSVLNTIKKASDKTDKLSMDLISNAADIYIENHANDFQKRNGSKFIIDMNELIEDGNLPSNIKISDIEDINDKCVQVTYINNAYSYELRNSGTCEYFLVLPDGFSIDLISNAIDIYIENHANDFQKRNGSKFIIDINELIEDGNLPSNIQIEDINDKCVQVTYINNAYSYELKNSGTCEYFLALPEEYQQIEYIESTGTQYLVIDYIASGNSSAKGTFQIMDISKAAFLFGSRASGGSKFFGLNWGGSKPYKYYNSYSGGIITTTVLDNQIHTFHKDKGELFIDSNSIGKTSYINFTTPGNMNVFGCNNNGTLGYLPPHARLFNLQFYDNDVLMVNLIPCYQKLDGEIGMYDLVNDTFYTNSGTGTFEKGADI